MPLRLALAVALLIGGCSAPNQSDDAGRTGAVFSSLPADPDPEARHLLYFHGRIIEDQGLPAVSPEHGTYEYEAILARLAEGGVTVVSEVRPRGADVTVHAERAAARIDSLRRAGVPPEHITLLGASKGAAIASLASHLARASGLRVVLLAGCSSGAVAYAVENGVDLVGDVLTIRDVADTELAGSCADVFAMSEEVGRSDEIVLDVGTGHGVLYRPLDAWVLPALAWATH